MRKTITFLLILVMMVASVSLALADVTAAQGANVTSSEDGGLEIITVADNSNEPAEPAEKESTAHNNPLYVAGE